MKLKNLIGKYAFISHPFANDPEGNRKKVDKVCKYWANKGIIPISPLHMFSFYEDDSNRDEIMNVCYKLIDIADAIFIYMEIVKDADWKRHMPKEKESLYLCLWKKRSQTYENNKT